MEALYGSRIYSSAMEFGDLVVKEYDDVGAGVPFSELIHKDWAAKFELSRIPLFLSIAKEEKLIWYPNSGPLLEGVHDADCVGAYSMRYSQPSSDSKRKQDFFSRVCEIENIVHSNSNPAKEYVYASWDDFVDEADQSSNQQLGNQSPDQMSENRDVTSGMTMLFNYPFVFPNIPREQSNSWVCQFPKYSCMLE